VVDQNCPSSVCLELETCRRQVPVFCPHWGQHRPHREGYRCFFPTVHLQMSREHKRRDKRWGGQLGKVTLCIFKWLYEHVPSKQKFG
jgi:hypothetical protein